MSPDAWPASLGGVVLLAYANGANDVSKAVATLVGGRVAACGKAVLWGALWASAGAALGGVLSAAMVDTFTTGILSADATLGPPLFPVAVTVGAAAWVLAASRAGLPVSTTHAITGAICGAALAGGGKDGGILWAALGTKIIAPLAISPVLALGLTAAVFPLVRRTVGGWKGVCLCIGVVRRSPIVIRSRPYGSPTASSAAHHAVLAGPPTLVAAYDTAENCGPGRGVALSLTRDSLHWASSGLVSFARGLNDAPKIVAPVFAAALMGGAQPLSPNSLFALAALAMGAGAVIGGLRVTTSLAEKVTPMEPVGGLAANLTTALLVTAAARLGVPVSTTHVSSGAIVGFGLGSAPALLNWRTVRHYVLAWVVTLPVAGLISALAVVALARLA